MRESYKTDLTDEQWAVIGPLLPAPKPGGRPRDGRTCARWSTRCCTRPAPGCQWDMLPHDLLPKSTVWDYFAAWRDDGTWQRVVDALRREVRVGEGRDPDAQRRLHRQPDGQDDRGGRRGRGYDGGKKVKGRKRHIVVDTLGLLLAVAVTAANLRRRHARPRRAGQAGRRQASRGWRWCSPTTSTTTTTLDEWLDDADGPYTVEVVSRPDGRRASCRSGSAGWWSRRSRCLNRYRRLSKDYERHHRLQRERGSRSPPSRACSAPQARPRTTDKPDSNIPRRSGKPPDSVTLSG